MIPRGFAIVNSGSASGGLQDSLLFPDELVGARLGKACFPVPAAASCCAHFNIQSVDRISRC